MGDITYFLTISNNTSVDGNIYMCEMKDQDEDENYKFDMSMSMMDALTFDTEKEAWDFRESVGRASTWQITPMPSKKIFMRKLNGQ